MIGFPYEIFIFAAVVGFTLWLIIRDYKRGPKKYATVSELLHLETKLNQTWDERFVLYDKRIESRIKEIQNGRFTSSTTSPAQHS
jgi:hypothetical protein